MINLSTAPGVSRVIVCLLLVSFISEVHGNIRGCIKAANELGKRGNGSTPTSCFYCDPALPVCSKGCQGKIKDLYYDCDGVCLPDGYYYDVNAGKLLSGCWPKVKSEIKIKVERCGCDSASTLSIAVPALLMLISIFFVYGM